MAEQTGIGVDYIVLAAELTSDLSYRVAHAAIKTANAGKDIVLVVQTMGGGGAFGLFVYHLLRALPVRVTAINMGTVASAGNYIYLAGDKRLCVPGAVFGFHYSKNGIVGNSNVVMRDIFLDRTKLDCAVGNTLVGGEGDDAVLKPVNRALNNGFVHEIVSSFRIPEGSCIISI